MRELTYRKLSKFNKAQAMVEFVIIVPVILTLVLGIIQFALIYKAKITLNYATFQTVRAGSLNNASLSEMNMAFSSNMAPLYTTSFLTINNSGDCTSSFLSTDVARRQRLGTTVITNAEGGVVGTSGQKITQGNNELRSLLDRNINNFSSESVLCARRIVQQQIVDGYVRISVVNPNLNSFNNFGVPGYYDVTGDGDVRTVNIIPNDNLMYRDAKAISSGTSGQSVQDANLLKIHVGYCYELVIPFINRMVWAMQRYGTGAAPQSERMLGQYWREPNSTPPGFFGPPDGDFANSCITSPTESGRRSIVLYSQALIRMQSAAVECETSDTCV
jgi:Flp pilus assembly protein TadG